MRCWHLLFLLLLIGCKDSSLPSKPQASESVAVSADESEVADLLRQYEQLMPADRNGLPGDKLVMRMETMLARLPSEKQTAAQPIIREHNERLLKRALSDPDLEEIVGTETAPPPREK